MKKLLLTSLVAVFSVSAANAANVINGDPLYRPDAGHFYSVTGLDSWSKDTSEWQFSEEFGYGITDKLAVNVSTSAVERNWFSHGKVLDDDNELVNWGTEWDSFSLGVNYRVLDIDNVKGDIYGTYTLGPVWADHAAFLDKDSTEYMWLIGARAGFTKGAWTLAGHVEYGYLNTESFNWDDEGIHGLRLGADALWQINQDWAFVTGAEYTTVLDKSIEGEKTSHEGVWTMKVGANLNIDETHFVGGYITKEMSHKDAGEWEFEDGFGFGVQFGVDF